MQLHFSKLGKGKNLVILHGLFGSGNNWMSIARLLSNNYTVYLVDQRNHGQSPHSQLHDYTEMANDMLEFCNSQNLTSFYLLGHSMGGKTAITFALMHPGMVEKLIVVDISPYSYLEHDFFAHQLTFHRTILNLFRETPLNETNSRADIERFFDESIHNLEIRRFLLKNLKRHSNGAFYWQLNVEAITKNFDCIIDCVPPIKLGAKSHIPALFFRGGISNYLPEDEIKTIPDVFPNAQFETFENAGHWLHFEFPDLFIEKTNCFLR